MPPQAVVLSCGAVVYDLNGREAAEAGLIIDNLPAVEQYIFCSSAGVYKKSDEMPHLEVDEGDPKSRHKVLPPMRYKRAATL